MLKVYEQLETGNYNFYVFRNKTWAKVNHTEITDFNKIDDDAISVKDFLNQTFDTENHKEIDKFITFRKGLEN